MFKKFNYKKILLLFVICFMFTSSGGAQSIDENNLIRNSQFDNGTMYWKFWADGSVFEVSISNDSLLSGQNSLKIGIGDGGTEYPYLSALQSVNLQRGNEYNISFMATADTLVDIAVGIQQAQYPYTDYWKESVLIGEKNHFGPYSFKMIGDQEEAELYFSLGGFKNVRVFIDSIVVEEKSTATAVQDLEMGSAGIPRGFSLLQNYPNPFNPRTTIQFELAETSTVSLLIFSVTGKLIKTLVADQAMNSGLYRLLWDGTDVNNEPVSSGVYLYQLRKDSFQQTKEMILLK